MSAMEQGNGQLRRVAIPGAALGIVLGILWDSMVTRAATHRQCAPGRSPNRVLLQRSAVRGSGVKTPQPEFSQNSATRGPGLGCALGSGKLWFGNSRVRFADHERCKG